MNAIEAGPTRRTRSSQSVVFAVAALVAAATVGAQQHWGGAGKKVAGGAEKLTINESAEQIAITLGADILFDFDKAELKSEAERSLTKVMEIAGRYPSGAVLVEGHTDGIGSERYNLELSRRRAEAVKAWLVGRGVASDRVETRGWGMSRPVAPNTNPDGTDSAAGRAKNRRVEITVRKG